jgi:hypothetical protein
MEISETPQTTIGHALLKIIDEVLESFWVLAVKVIDESSSLVESRIQALGARILRIISEVLEASWTFALTHVIGETEDVREGEFEAVIQMSEVVSEIVRLVELVSTVLALRLVEIISDSITVYDSLTRLIARAVMGIIMVVGDVVGINESWFTRRIRDRRITRWLERRTRR